MLSYRSPTTVDKEPLIPAGKYLSGLVKTGKTAGIVGVKTSLKTVWKEGLEQGAKNLDNFKGVLKNIKSFGDNILSKVKTYGAQLDNLRPNKVLSRTVDAVSDTLRSTDNLISEAAQNFRLNMGLEPQLVSGVMPSSNGKLANIAYNLSAFAKNLDGSVDEVERGANRVSSKFSSEAFEGGVEAGKNLADDAVHLNEVEEVINKTSKDIITYEDDVPRLKEEIEINFNHNAKHDEAEFGRQLGNQEKGMNELTVQEYLDNRKRYIAEGRSKEARWAQRTARKEAFSEKYVELVRSGKSRLKANIEARKWLRTQAALHDPDQIAGGYANRIGGMGDRGVNHSIGAQWKFRIGAVDEQIQALAKQMTPEQLQNTYLNIRLTY